MIAENEQGSGPDGEVLFHDIVEKMKGSMVNPNMIMLLDVATRYCGYAFFERTELKPPPFELVGYGVFKSVNSKSWEERCLSLTAKISNIIHTVKPAVLVLEYPTFQAGAKGTQAARQGSTLQLAYLCGRITMAWEFYITKVMADAGIMLSLTRLIEFRQWGGQLKKKHTCKRCEDHFSIKADPNSIENNYVDAIMMGKYFIENEPKGVALKGHKAERVDL